DGLGLVFDLLAARRRGESLRGMVAQTLIPLPLTGEVAAHSRARFSQAMYDACLRSIYAPLADDEVPQQDDEQAPHAPQPIGFYDEVAAAQSLSDISQGTLKNASFEALRERLELLLNPAGEPDP
ncbi:MAG: hypothetical protein KC613_06260, partial [Myxococcales bacterium]|nr:hypothetical protein [Myxococcales bacterium]